MICKLWRMFMGRPRVLRLPSGAEVIIKNASPEEAESLKAQILGEPKISAGDGPATKPNEAEAGAAGEAAPAASSASLNHTALGTYRDAKGWHVVRVKYNPATGEAQVGERVSVGPDRFFVEERFKIMVVEHDLF